MTRLAYALPAAVCLFFGTSAAAMDITARIDQCDALTAEAVQAAQGYPSQTSEWSNLNYFVRQNRVHCGTVLALACHLSQDPEGCFAEAIAQLDARTEAARQALLTYRDGGGVLFGAVPELVSQTPLARETGRVSECAQPQSEAATAVRSLNGNDVAACQVGAVAAQWASMAWAASATRTPGGGLLPE